MTREEAIKILKAIRVYECYPKSASEETKEAIDMAIESLTDRPKGEWIPHATSVGLKHYIEYARCSECGEMALISMHFCPNCGAKMDGERREP